MERWKGIASFLTILVVVFVLLRLLNLAVPLFYPKVLSGPFSLDGLDQVEEYTGFSPRVPFYRPEVLGARPVNITVTRRPYPKVVVFWQGEHFLRLEEQRGGRLPPTRPSDRPLAGHPGWRWWREGRTIHAALGESRLWIELRTDLSLQDVERIVDTLRPYRELR